MFVGMGEFFLIIFIEAVDWCDFVEVLKVMLSTDEANLL